MIYQTDIINDQTQKRLEFAYCSGSRTYYLERNGIVSEYHSVNEIRDKVKDAELLECILNFITSIALR